MRSRLRARCRRGRSYRRALTGRPLAVTEVAVTEVRQMMPPPRTRTRGRRRRRGCAVLSRGNADERPRAACRGRTTSGATRSPASTSRRTSTTCSWPRRFDVCTHSRVEMQMKVCGVQPLVAEWQSLSGYGPRVVRELRSMRQEWRSRRSLIPHLPET